MVRADEVKKDGVAIPRILIAAGGTGGHVIPAQVLARELQRRGYQVHFAASGLNSNKFFGKQEFQFSDISARPFSLSSPFKMVDFIKNLAVGSLQGCRLLNSVLPEVVIGFGSYHTVSVLSAAWLKRIPIILHEANAHPGQVVRLFSPAAEMTGCYFPEAQIALSRARTKLVDLPVRTEIQASSQIEKAFVMGRYGFQEACPTVLVIGGSQGAKGINRIAPEALTHAAHMLQLQNGCHSRLQILHISGSDEETLRLQEYYKMHQDILTATVISYEAHMEYAYKACDIAIARSGASTIAELSCLNMPAIFIPYPHAKDNHQYMNAKACLAMQECIGEILTESQCSAKGAAKKMGEMLLRLMHVDKGIGMKTARRSSFVDEVERLIKKRKQTKNSR